MKFNYTCERISLLRGDLRQIRVTTTIEPREGIAFVKVNRSSQYTHTSQFIHIVTIKTERPKTYQFKYILVKKMEFFQYLKSKHK